MKNFVSCLCISFAALLGACGKSPTSSEVVGTWANTDGAGVKIEQDGQFSAWALPAAIFVWHDQTGTLEGKGTWKLQKGRPYWEVELWFHELTGRPANQAVTVLVSGSGESINLYQWKGEEGGPRYELERKPPTAR